MPELAAPIDICAAPLLPEIEATLQGQAEELTALDVTPRLMIVTDNNRGPIRDYIRFKRVAGEKLGVEVDVREVGDIWDVADQIDEGNNDSLVHGIIVQLPLRGHADCAPQVRRAADSRLINRVAPDKDVDGLAKDSLYDPATALGIMDLLRYYVSDFAGKRTALVGYGDLVNRPLHKLLTTAGVEFLDIVDANTGTKEKRDLLHAAELIISATGHPGSLSLDLVGSDKPTIIFDAGTAEREGRVLPDSEPELRLHAETTPGWGITRAKGAIGPMTVHKLHANTLDAASKVAGIGWRSESIPPQAYADRLAYGLPIYT